MTAARIRHNSPIVWTHPELQRWSASRRGEPFGSVERTETGFAARSFSGALIAVSITLDAAQAALTTYGADALPSRPRRLPSDHALKLVASTAGALATVMALLAAVVLFVQR